MELRKRISITHPPPVIKPEIRPIASKGHHCDAIFNTPGLPKALKNLIAAKNMTKFQGATRTVFMSAKTIVVIIMAIKVNLGDLSVSNMTPERGFEKALAA